MGDHPKISPSTNYTTVYLKKPKELFIKIILRSKIITQENKKLSL